MRGDEGAAISVFFGSPHRAHCATFSPLGRRESAKINSRSPISATAESSIDLPNAPLHHCKLLIQTRFDLIRQSPIHKLKSRYSPFLQAENAGCKPGIFRLSPRLRLKDKLRHDDRTPKTFPFPPVDSQPSRFRRRRGFHQMAFVDELLHHFRIITRFEESLSLLMPPRTDPVPRYFHRELSRV